jgi:hypothetical protein
MFFWRNKAVTLDHIRELAKVCSQLREDLDDLAAKHERLRGRFYALNGKTNAKAGPDDETSDPDAEGSAEPVARARAKSRANANPNSGLTKSELLAKYWRPGRPAIHTGS